MDDKTIIMTFTNEAWTAPGSLLLRTYSFVTSSSRTWTSPGCGTEPASPHPDRHGHVVRPVLRRQADNPYDLNKSANGGFVYAKASPRMMAFYGSWNGAQAAYPGAHEQDVFDQVKRNLTRCARCTPANCLIGLQAKLQKLTELFGEWKQFREKAALLGSNTTALTD
ncbi:hypothetical protein HU200_038044 [Digitaria exilis]|uniref:Nucleotide-diphospho-sugar transferase domain-containing protein n=1 Tax=Digitaria exilis TaxID=1010633 RepID=A0A835EGX7_9POAL|nr:hypothetical protein HU200_038044 [Digitaria exilis]